MGRLGHPKQHPTLVQQTLSLGPTTRIRGRVTDFGGHRFQEIDRARGQPLDMDWGRHQAERAWEEAALAGEAAAAAAVKHQIRFQNPLKGTGAMQEGQNTDDE